MQATAEKVIGERQRRHLRLAHAQREHAVLTEPDVLLRIADAGAFHLATADVLCSAAISL